MKISVTSHTVTITEVGSSITTEDHWMEAYLKHREIIATIPFFSIPLRFPKLSKNRAAVAEKVLLCLWLVLRGQLVTPEFYPEDSRDQDVVETRCRQCDGSYSGEHEERFQARRLAFLSSNTGPGPQDHETNLCPPTILLL